MSEWIYPYIKKNRGRTVLTILFAFLGIASGAMLLFMSGYLISKSSLRPENIMLLYVPIVSVRAFSIGQAVFPYLEKLMSHDIVLRILATYRKRLYDLLEPQALSLQSRYQTGDILSVLSDDIEKLQDFYIRTLFPSIVGTFIYVIIAVIIGFFDLKFMLMLLALLGIIVFLMPFIALFKMRKQYVSLKEKRKNLYEQMTDAMFGQLDWLVSGRVKEVFHYIKTENNSLIDEENQINKWHHKRDALLRFIVGIVIVITMIWTNVQADEGSISATVIAAFVLMMFSITDALLPMSDAVEEIPVYVDSLNRIENIDRHNKPEQALDTGDAHLAAHLANRDKAFRMDNPTIHINNVSYQYEDNSPSQPVIDRLSMTIEQGKKIALLGKSGTGKSTLLKIIAGLIKPCQGDIYLNDLEVNSSFLGNTVSVLNQKPHLFHTTIANNVRIGKQDATEDEIIHVLEQAQIMDLVQQLPHGIHTQMNEMGKRFSGGERQRIAFARVLIQQTPIILMDEPTTGLDPKTERDLLFTMLEAAKDKTIIWVTHHLAGAELMDEIIFLDNGNIRIRGHHTDLIQTNNYYRKLYKMDNSAWHPNNS